MLVRLSVWSRPFRINAGPVHSYALLGDGSTKYLSELCAGDQARKRKTREETAFLMGLFPRLCVGVPPKSKAKEQTRVGL